MPAHSQVYSAGKVSICILDWVVLWLYRRLVDVMRMALQMFQLPTVGYSLERKTFPLRLFQM